MDCRGRLENVAVGGRRQALNHVHRFGQGAATPDGTLRVSDAGYDSVWNVLQSRVVESADEQHDPLASAMVSRGENSSRGVRLPNWGILDRAWCCVLLSSCARPRTGTNGIAGWVSATPLSVATLGQWNPSTRWSRRCAPGRPSWSKRISTACANTG